MAAPIADDILWELAYAPSLGHPAQLSGRKEAVRHATWFVGAVEKFRFFDLNVYLLADVRGAVAEVKGEGLIKSTGRMYGQDYVVFLRAVDGKIAFLREYLNRCGPPRRWTHRFLESNPEDRRGARVLAGQPAGHSFHLDAASATRRNPSRRILPSPDSK